MTGNLKTTLILFTFILTSATLFAQNKFRIVLDAGHGGKDYGIIHNGYIEKKITLNVALKVGELLEKDSQIELIYIRKTDAFIELSERAGIANTTDADIFVTLHCNGDKTGSTFGAETFVMGSSRNASNLEVALKENSVVTLEPDYKTKYNGFDPKASTITINNERQPKITEKSITLASEIQKSFDKIKRNNRGVKQAPLWVLNQTNMPGVLVELGFLSNKSEGEYLNSDNGQNELAKAIAEAIFVYKKEYYNPNSKEARSELPEIKNEKPDVVAVKEREPVKAPEVKNIESAVSKGVLFKVQIAASGKNLDLSPENFNGLAPVTKSQETSIIKYYYGETANYNKTKELVAEAKAKGYTSAFVVAFKNGKKISLQEALK